MSITSNCMVVNVHFGTWLGQRLDREESERITARANAESGAARAIKNLIPKEALATISTASSHIKTHFYNATLPWKDNGDRLLLRKNYAAFMSKHTELVDRFYEAVETFLSVTYPSAVQKAEFRMGTLFKADDYPPVALLRNKFYVQLDIDAVPEHNDFRITIDNAFSQNNALAVQQQRQTAMERNITTAMTSVWSKLATIVEHFADRMATEDATFKDTTVTKLEELVAALPDLNLTNDPNLERIRSDISARLLAYSPRELRKDREARVTAAVEAKRIMDQMQGYMKAMGGTQ